MSFALIKYTPECSELGDTTEILAYSNDDKALEKYVTDELHSVLGKFEPGSMNTQIGRSIWDPYYEIIPSVVILL